MSTRSGNVQWGPEVVVLDIDISTMLQQTLNTRQIVVEATLHGNNSGFSLHQIDFKLIFHTLCLITGIPAVIVMSGVYVSENGQLT